MKKEDILKLVPKDKFDTSAIAVLMEISEEDVQAILPDLLGWIADMNWPFARKIIHVLARFPSSLVPLIQNALSSEEKDIDFKNSILVNLLPLLPIETQNILMAEIRRNIFNPTRVEEVGGVLEAAGEYISSRVELKKPMPPQWMRYPHIHPASIGWRMGYGEEYLLKLIEWQKSLSENEKAVYEAMYPEPFIWKHDFYNYVDMWTRSGKPNYSLEKLAEKFKFHKDHNIPWKSEFLFFWRPGKEPEACLGQWQPTDFKNDFGEYSCAEQYMMAEKARLFEDKEIEAEIMASSDPKTIKALGKKVKNFNDDVWDKTKYWIVVNGNYLKFTQNKKIRDFLLSTGDKILVEASPYDTIWGIGLEKDDPRTNDPTQWRGKNLLGFALMEVRNEIRRVYENYDKIDWSQFKD